MEVDDCIRPEDENTPVCYEEELELRKEEARQKRDLRRRRFPPDADSDDEGFTCDDFPTSSCTGRAILRLFCDYVMNYARRGRTRNIYTLCELLIDEWRALKDNDGSEELLEQKSEDIMALLRSDAPYDRMVAHWSWSRRASSRLCRVRDPGAVAATPRPRPRRRRDVSCLLDAIDATSCLLDNSPVAETAGPAPYAVRDEVRPGTGTVPR